MLFEMTRSGKIDVRMKEKWRENGKQINIKRILLFWNSFRVESNQAGLVEISYVKCFGSLQFGDLYLIYGSRGSSLKSYIV